MFQPRSIFQLKTRAFALYIGSPSECGKRGFINPPGAQTVLKPFSTTRWIIYKPKGKNSLREQHGPGLTRVPGLVCHLGMGLGRTLFLITGSGRAVPDQPQSEMG